jgi:hypothetical protein
MGNTSIKMSGRDHETAHVENEKGHGVLMGGDATHVNYGPFTVNLSEYPSEDYKSTVTDIVVFFGKDAHRTEIFRSKNDSANNEVPR